MILLFVKSVFKKFKNINANIVFQKCFSALKTNGLFLLGWNRNDQAETNDPRNIKSLNKFEPTIFEALKTNRYNVSDGEFARF